jgi:hypothetical protein
VSGPQARRGLRLVKQQQPGDVHPQEHQHGEQHCLHPRLCPDTIAADVGSCLGSAALVIAEHGRLEAGQDRSAAYVCVYLGRSDDCNGNGTSSRHTKPSGINQSSPKWNVLDRRAQELDRSSRRSHLQLIGQLADFRRRVAAVATKGLQERQSAFLGPAGHGAASSCS